MEDHMAGQAVRITLLIDNRPGRPGLRSQWGFAAWIDTGSARVLVDSGKTDAFWRNAAELGVPLAAADAFVLSHGHGDHGGGLHKAVDAAPAARLVLHPGAMAPHYWLAKTGKVDPIGLPDRSLAALRTAAGRTVWALAPVQAAPGIWASGPVPRRHPLEEAERNFFLDRSCTVRDQVVDDQCVWVETSAGLVMVLGCAHAGVANTLAHVRQTVADRWAAGGEPGAPAAADGLPAVCAVVGGMHLLHAPPARIRATGDALEAAGVRLVAPVHCTGRRGTAYLRARFGDAFVEAATGSVLAVGQL
jgi:7,8-dihydropterin-6-yl-methyl-4-(beta-D-ribofuranosyl)aminobenzene 5'-phosphate synthase